MLMMSSSPNRKAQISANARVRSQLGQESAATSTRSRAITTRTVAREVAAKTRGEPQAWPPTELGRIGNAAAHQQS